MQDDKRPETTKSDEKQTAAEEHNPFDGNRQQTEKAVEADEVEKEQEFKEAQTERD